MCPRAITCILFLVALCGFASAQTHQNLSSACSFNDGKQISVRYQSAAVNKIPEGKLWSPGDSPMFFFTDTPLKIENSQIPMGAYSMYIVPQRNDWILVLNKNVNEGSKYDERLDLLRVPMQIGQLDDKEPFKVLFGHVSPGQCNMRIYEGKTGTWTEFKEQ